jgi:beta-mannosidase
MRTLKKWSLDDAPRRFDAQDWWYRLQFDAPSTAEGARVILGLDGLATVARVWLNGEELLCSYNMFVAHECDVTARLSPTGNTLLLLFSSLDHHLKVRRNRPRWRAPMIENQQLRWFRTTVLGRTPGWSPPAAVVGPWKDVWLEHRRHFELSDVRLDARVQGTSGTLHCSLHWAALGGSIAESIEVHLVRQGSFITQCLKGDGNNFRGDLVVPEVQRWWPHTHGQPNLYSVSLQVRVVGVDHVMSIDLGRVGFRTILLDCKGGDFSISVNDVPIFCRGACWTPLDVVRMRSSASECLAAVQQVQVAGMNMLRVAGTMVYEEDHFYEACDEMGILVWQDLMFANMDYPYDDATFMQSVDIEVCQQIERLRSHASLAILCGNSEVAQQAAMWGTPRELWQSPLFNDTLAQRCVEIAPAIPYWPSSAHGGSFPHQADAGTTSYYGVGAYLRGLDDARRSQLKFATECLAFANIPADTALKRMPGGFAIRVHQPAWKMRSPRDLGAGWDFDDVRDHYMKEVFGVEPAKLRYADHERYLALGRMVTGEAMAAAFAEWRRPASLCRGAMILFMRDLWAGAGWGVVDDAGVPKACYHYLKRVLQPITVLLTDEGGNGLFVHLINETGNQLQVVLEISAWKGGDVLVAKGQRPLQLPANSAQSLPCLDWFGSFQDLTYAYRFGPKPCDIVVATLRGHSGHQIAQAFYFLGGLDSRQEPDVGLTAVGIMVDANTMELKVSTQRLAIGVYLDVPGFQPDNEYFHLVPGSECQITLRSVDGPREPLGTIHAINALASARILRR